MTTAPFTGWSRQTWEDYADRLLLSAREWASPCHARFRFPGVVSLAGRDSDELEGFARTFLLAGFRLAGSSAHPHGFAQWYAAGLDAGTDPRSPEYWPSPSGSPSAQPKVEAASIALILSLTRTTLWDVLDDRVKANVIEWLRPVIGERYLQNNWLWFQLIVESFLRSVGVDTPGDALERGLQRTEDLYRSGGWYSDGDARNFDHYNGWAWHFYPLLWTIIEPQHPLAIPARVRFESRLRDFLDDAVHLIGADGSPLIQGRSLIYRFGAAAPFWMGALTGATNLSPGTLRRAASGIVKHFADRGVPDDRGLLTVGWHREWPAMRQEYSGASSAYWASKGMLGLALPADHPVWVDEEQPLPIEVADFTRLLIAPGWAVSGTRDDGIIRIANHGADLVSPGADAPDHALYTGIGYSTATFPPAVDDSLSLAQGTTVIDQLGRPASRAGFLALAGGSDDQAVLASSRHRASPVAADDGAPASVTVTSVLHGQWEVRIARINGRDPARVRIGGWALAGTDSPAATTAHNSASVIDASGLRSVVRIAHGRLVTSEVTRASGVSPLGDESALPSAHATSDDGDVIAVIGLGRDLTKAPLVTRSHSSIEMTWSDGRRSALTLDESMEPPIWTFVQG